MKIIVVGFGTVGQGFAKTLASSRDLLAKRGTAIQVVGLLDSKSAAVSSGGLDMMSMMERKKNTGRVGERTLSLGDVMEKVEADAVVELTPGSASGEPALSHIRDALEASKNVVTANKMPLALQYSELLGTAKRRGVAIRYTACVGGGLPVLEFGRLCAAAEPVEKIEGVVNATTNFVLSEMERGEAYDLALERAQGLGYAEPDPSFDVDGIDAACKVVILANHVLGTSFALKDVKPLRGIAGVTQERVGRAKSKGMALRLVAEAGKSVSVSPTEVDAQSPLAAIGRSHAVVFHCKNSGERTIAGSGAGSVTTSIGVLRDLLALAEGTAA